ncbi:GM11519 [Drosophila sechellia]|uniref:Glycosyltransferase family 92 protein n=1 Tax=Drosophila sechellia TaxID=7238 RepID=B4IGL7_DROSE|nr:GM11519 [Drosophila sechellia]
MTDRFVEWLELMRLLGATKVTAFDIGQLMPNTMRTLAHYTEAGDGFFDLRKFRFPNETADHETFRAMIIEVLLYNDCLYRTMLASILARCSTIAIPKISSPWWIRRP